MNNMLEHLFLWIDENWIISLVILGEILVVVYIILQIRERRKNKKLEQAEKRNAKMRNLERRLTNPRWLDREKKTLGKYLPYENEFHELAEVQGETDTQVNLEVESPLVSQKFLASIGNGITLGTAEDCEVIVSDQDVAPHHCVITQDKSSLLLKRLDTEHATVLERGRKFMKVSEKEVRLQQNDRINMGGSIVTIALIQRA